MPQVNFAKRAGFVIEQNGWQMGLESDHHVYNLFIDGFEMRAEVGAAVFCLQFDLQKSNQCSIFHGEIYSVTKAAELAL